MGLKDNVKPNFVHFATPDQLQFYNWMDWIRWIDENVPMADVEGLIAALNLKADKNTVRPEKITVSDDTTFLMLAEYNLERVSFKNKTGTPMTITINNNPGNIIPQYEVELPASGEADLDIGKTFWTETLLYISGIVGEVDLLIFRK